MEKIRKSKTAENKEIQNCWKEGNPTEKLAGRYFLGVFRDDYTGIAKPFVPTCLWTSLKRPAYIQKAGDASDTLPPIFWIFRQILGWARGTH